MERIKPLHFLCLYMLFVKHNSDYKGDGVGVTKEQVKSIKTARWFSKNKVIEYFNEFEQFIGVTGLEHTNSFDECTNLKEIKLPSALTYLPPNSITYTLLVELRLPNSVNYIREGALQYNYRLKKIYMPDIPPTLSGWDFIKGYTPQLICSSESVKQAYLSSSSWGQRPTLFVVE